MAVSVAGAPLSGVAALSPKAQGLLMLSPGAAAWVDWAVARPEDGYAFDGEEQLVGGVQSGLHGGPLLVVPQLGLQVDMQRLWQALSADEVQALHDAIGRGDQASLQAARATLAAKDLRTQDELAGADRFLADLGVAGAPLFQAMTLGDRIALLELAGDPGEASSRAAAFALERAVNVGELVDLYRFHRLVGGDDGPAADERAAAAVAALEPPIRTLLSGLVVGQDLTAQDVGALVRRWLDSGNAMGFSTVTRGLLEVARGADGDLTDGAAAQHAVDGFTRRVRALLLDNEPSSVALSQDGCWQLFQVTGTEGNAVLGRRRISGTLTLNRFDGR